MTAIAIPDTAARTAPHQPAEHPVIARSATIRAESIRQQVARMPDTLEPLRTAWRRRAAELELAATALWDAEPVRPTLVHAFLGRTA